jgi:hypothetical protein
MKNRLFLCTAFLTAISSHGIRGEGKTAAPGPDQLDKLQALIKPAAGEARWAQVPWMPASDIWAARQKAAREGKPLFLWYMAGEPLGTC